MSAPALLTRPLRRVHRDRLTVSGTSEGSPVISTTGPALRRRLVRLTVLTGVLLLTSTVALVAGQRVADRMDAQAARAMTGVADARLALVEADSAAMTELSGSAARLTGPGEEYTGKITLAIQSLEQVAEVNTAGAQGRQSLQLLSSMIGTYNGLVEKANTAYAVDDDLLGATRMWNASDLLHTAILDELQRLDERRSSALVAADTSFWTSSWTVLLWLVPGLALLAVLIDTQIFLRQRFRRRLNPALAAATLLAVVAVTVAPALAASVNGRLSRGAQELEQVRASRVQQSEQHDAIGQKALAELLREKCSRTDASCALTVGQVTERGKRANPSAASAMSAPATAPAARLGSAAGTGLNLVGGMIVICVAIFLLVPAGLRRRLGEYEYQA